MKYDFLTIASVYGHNDGSSSIPALLKSSNAFPGAKVLLMSVVKPLGLPEKITWKRIAPLSYQQYSIFMIYCLNSFIDTDYVLCVQDDGWVLNKECWSEDFLNYDYIGAPTAVGLVTPTLPDLPGFKFDGKLLRADWQWIKEEKPIGVLNGGFSLRSKKFIRAPSDIGLAYHFDENQIRQNEDLQLCIFMREELSDHGLKFPSFEISKKFSFEFAWPIDFGAINLKNCFGIHGPYLRLISDQQIIFEDKMNSHYLGLAGELHKLGYEINF